MNKERWRYKTDAKWLEVDEKTQQKIAVDISQSSVECVDSKRGYSQSLTILIGEAIGGKLPTIMYASRGYPLNQLFSDR